MPHPTPANLELYEARLVQLADSALADAVRRSGSHLACRPGCSQCCHGAFPLNALDARRLRAGMAALRISDPDRATRVKTRAVAWLAKHGLDFPGNVETGILGTSEADELAFEDYANDTACPALEPESGLCDLYSARPMTCRVFGPPVRSGEEGGLAVCELCFTHAEPEEIAACEMLPPHQQEDALLQQLPPSQRDTQTVVAFCLLPDYAPTAS